MGRRISVLARSRKLRLLLLSAGALALALLFLARVAIGDIAIDSRQPLAPPVLLALQQQGTGPELVVTGGDGGARVHRGSALVAEIRNHSAPVVGAYLIDGGGRLVTADLLGEVRITRLGTGAVPAPRLAGLSAWLGRVVWRPYGAPAARWILDGLAPAYRPALPSTATGRQVQTFKDCPDCPEMVEISPGWTYSGAGGGRVDLVGPGFALARLKLTKADWQDCVDGGGCSPLPPSVTAGSPQAYARGIGRGEAAAYLRWLSRRAGRTYRLPTDSEWDYAARAGSALPLDELASAANRFGLFRMLTTPPELVCSRVNRAAPATCVAVVARGASAFNFSDSQGSTTGLRVARDVTF